MITNALAALGAAIVGFLSVLFRWSPPLAVALIGFACACSLFGWGDPQTAWEAL